MMAPIGQFATQSPKLRFSVHPALMADVSSVIATLSSSIEMLSAEQTSGRESGEQR